RSAWDAGVEGRMPRVAFVGFVSPLRGVDTLVEACRILWSAGCRFELILIGHARPADRLWIDRAVQRADGRIRYLGVRPSDETLREMSVATVGVLPFPERRETAPVQAVTGVEYLSLGKPIVATALVGARALVEEGVNGFLVPPGDGHAMAEAIGTLMRDPARTRSMGEAARRKSAEFDV